MKIIVAICISILGILDFVGYSAETNLEHTEKCVLFLSSDKAFKKVNLFTEEDWKKAATFSDAAAKDVDKKTCGWYCTNSSHPACNPDAWNPCTGGNCQRYCW